MSSADRSGAPDAIPTRERILRAAAEEAADEGRLSVNEIARRAGVSRQAVHYHFRGIAGVRAALEAAGTTPPASVPDTRERILDAAQRVLSRPWTRAGIDEIAAEAGVTKGAVYHHFGERSALLRAVAERVTPTELEFALLADTDALSDRDALAVLLRTYHRAVAARADLVRNLVIASRDDPELVEVMAGAMITRLAPTLLGWYGRRAERGAFRDVPPSLVFQALFGPVFAQIVFGPFLEQVLARVGGRPAAEAADMYAELLLHGLSTPASTGMPAPAPTTHPGSPAPADDDSGQA